MKTQTRKETLSPVEIKKIKTLLQNEIATRKNHLVSSVLSNDFDYRAKSIEYAEEIKEMQKTFAKFNGADMALEGASYNNGVKSDVEFFAYSE